MSILTTYSTNQGLKSGLGAFTVAKLLAANVPEVFTVPTDQNGILAKYVTFGKGAAADFYAQCYDSVTGADRATNGTFAEYVTNGAFGSDTGWTKGTGWTIAAGVADCDGTQTAASVLTQPAAIALIPGYTYTVTFTTSSVSAGTVTASIGGTAGTARSTSATFSQAIVAGADGTIAFTADEDFVGKIDNVTVTAWVLGAGWTTDGSTAIATGAISTALSQTANAAYPLVAGQAYLVTFTATRSAGSVTVNVGGTAGTARSSSATFAEVIIAGATQAISFTTSGFTGTIDNVTIIPAASVPADSTAGVTGEQNPEGYFLNGVVTAISVVSAGTPIITASFYR